MATKNKKALVKQALKEVYSDKNDRRVNYLADFNWLMRNSTVNQLIAARNAKVAISQIPNVQIQKIDPLISIQAQINNQGDPKIRARMEKGLKLAPEVHMIGDKIFSVPSDSQGDSHIVSDVCDCKDYAFRHLNMPNFECGHMLAKKFAIQMFGIAKLQADREVTKNVSVITHEMIKDQMNAIKNESGINFSPAYLRKSRVNSRINHARRC